MNMNPASMAGIKGQKPEYAVKQIFVNGQKSSAQSRLSKRHEANYVKNELDED